MVKWIFPCLNKGTDNLMNGSVSIWRGASRGEQGALTFVCIWGKVGILPLIMAKANKKSKKQKGRKPQNDVAEM